MASALSELSKHKVVFRTNFNTAMKADEKTTVKRVFGKDYNDDNHWLVNHQAITKVQDWEMWTLIVKNGKVAIISCHNKALRAAERKFDNDFKYVTQNKDGVGALGDWEWWTPEVTPGSNGEQKFTFKSAHGCYLAARESSGDLESNLLFQQQNVNDAAKFSVLVIAPNVKITDIVLNVANAKTEILSTVQLCSQTMSNPTANQMQVPLHLSQQRDDVCCLGTTSCINFYNASFTAETISIKNNIVVAQANQTSAHRWTSSFELHEKKKLEVDFPFIVPANTSMKVSGTVHISKVVIPWTGKTEVTELNNKTATKFDLTGVWICTVLHDLRYVISDIEVPAPPAAVDH
jgi:hypothetical protein